MVVRMQCSVYHDELNLHAMLQGQMVLSLTLKVEDKTANSRIFLQIKKEQTSCTRSLNYTAILAIRDSWDTTLA